MDVSWSKGAQGEKVGDKINSVMLAERGERGEKMTCCGERAKESMRVNHLKRQKELKRGSVSDFVRSHRIALSFTVLPVAPNG